MHAAFITIMNKRTEKTILVADDDLFYREIVSSHLESLGYSVVKTSSGAKAHELLQADGRYDLAILDVFMGGKSGIEVLERFKRSVDLCGIEDMPIIIMTSDDSEETELRIRAARATLLLLKPFTKEALTEVVEQLVRCKPKPRAKWLGDEVTTVIHPKTDDKQLT